MHLQAVAVPRVWTRPTLAHLGLHRAGALLLTVNTVAVGLTVALYAATGLTLDWRQVLPFEVLFVLTAVIGLFMTLSPGRPSEWWVAESAFLLSLMLFLANVAAPLQYAALAVGTPYADPWLAAGDAVIGIHVPTLAAWTSAHPALLHVLTLAYRTFQPQVACALLFLILTRQRAKVWEFVFQLHVCLLVTVLMLLVAPAICPPAYYGFTPAMDLPRAFAQIQALHNGTLTQIEWGMMDGLVSVPSFHTGAALVTLWALRGSWLRWPLLVINTLLIAATMLTGVHYAVDVLAAVPLVWASIAIWRRYGAGWLAV